MAHWSALTSENLSTSVRLVRTVSSDLTATFNQREMGHSRTNEPSGRNSISVTRDPDVERLQATDSTDMTDMNGRQTRHGGGQPSDPRTRLSKSAGALQKPPAMIAPRLSTDDRQRSTLMARESLAVSSTASTTDDLSKKTKLPQFRQSKKWERYYKSATVNQPDTPDERSNPQTAREKSMEEQRATFTGQSSLERKPPPQLNSKPSLVSIQDSQSIVLSGGLCRPLSLPTWHVARGAAISRPQSLPREVATQVASLRRKNTMVHKRSGSTTSSVKDVSFRREQKRRRHRTKRAIADLRRRAGWVSRSELAPHTPEVASPKSPPGFQPDGEDVSSLKRFLHDSDGMKRFSQECQAMFNGSTLGPDTILSFDCTTKIRDFANSDVKDIDKLAPTTEQKDDSASNNAAASIPVNQTPKSTVVSAPEPPERTSSRGGARLPQIAYFSKPKYTTITNGSKDDKELNDVAQGIEEHGEATQESKRTTFRSRMPLNFSIRSVKGPRHAVSTDSLAKIETEMLKSQQMSTFEKLKKSAAFIRPQLKRNDESPSGTPPEVPLPDLPSGDQFREPIEVTETVKTPPLTAVDEIIAEGLSVSQGYERLQNEAGSQKSPRRLQNTAASKSLSIQASQQDIVGVSDATPTPTSLYSQASVDSQQSALLKKSFSRHDYSRFRGDRMNDLKKRYQHERNRERRISEEDESKIDAAALAMHVATQSKDLAARPSVDEIDKFPAVPTSRPQSRASTTRNLSRARSHVRQTSRANSRRGRGASGLDRQPLGKSDIKILVDTDPKTGSWRAGAMSPEPSVSGSQDGSPARFSRALRPESLQDVTNITKLVGSRNSMRSMTSHGSTRRSKFASKPYRRGSGDGELESEQESPLRAPVQPPKSELRKRRDRISTSHASSPRHLNADEVRCRLLALEERNKIQEEQNRAILNHLRELTMISRKGLLLAPSASEPSKLRPISDISTASATSTATNATYSSTARASVASAGEASLTDPFEYDDLIIPTKRLSTAKSNALVSKTPLHRPPPVAEVITKGKLPEEMSLISMGEEVEIGERQATLRLDQSFTVTDMMDRALENGVKELQALGHDGSYFT